MVVVLAVVEEVVVDNSIIVGEDSLEVDSVGLVLEAEYTCHVGRREYSDP